MLFLRAADAHGQLSPFPVTAMVAHAGVDYRWAFATPLGIGALTCIAIAFTWRFERLPPYEAAGVAAASEKSGIASSGMPKTTDATPAGPSSNKSNLHLRAILTSRTCWLFCLVRTVQALLMPSH
jgi:hypothetical protein